MTSTTHHLFTTPLTNKEVGRRLREERNRLGLSLQRVEERTLGELKAVVVGSYERADRAASIERVSEVLAHYGTARLAIIGADETIIPAATYRSDESAVAEYGVRIGGIVYPVSSVDEALALAAAVDGATVEKRLVRRSAWLPD